MGRTFFARIILLFLAACTPLAAAVAVYLPPEALARRAVVVVEGTVTRTASGHDPRTGRLATYVSLEVERTHRGPDGLGTVVLRELGGVVNGMVHEVDAVPVYTPGERVLVFLEPAGDGTLRTAGMFFGKYSLTRETTGPAQAVRDLDPRGLLRRRGAPKTETVRVDQLIRALETPVEPRSATRFRGRPGRRPITPPPADGFHAVPPELSRLRWGPAPEAATPLRVMGNGTVDLGVGGDAPARSRFAPLSGSSPTRWAGTDVGSPVRINIQRSGDPLGNGAAAAAEIARAAAAWTDIPSSRLVVQVDDDDYLFTAAHGQSPAVNYSGTNIVLFGDPYDDISDPVGCSGVLAVGGYWRSSSTGAPINGVEFHPALQLYVIFNDGFECFLGDPDNLAEVATHELGHGLGFGHSGVPDAIMRSTAYGDRGPVLGDDDRDGAHCHYPHTLELLAPDGGESWGAGETHDVTWSTTPEDGPDAGVVTLEYTVDGVAWQPLAADTGNDGSHPWQLPPTPAPAARVRIRRPNSPTAPAEYPAACSEDLSDGSFSIAAPPGPAGAIAAGSLNVNRGAGGSVELAWNPSCSAGASDYSVYEGSLDALRTGGWDHVARACSTGGETRQTVSPGFGARYFLIAPVAPTGEGRFGRSTGGTVRPASSFACTPREQDSGCGS